MDIHPGDKTTTILEPGRNCRAIKGTQCLRFLIDGEAYFEALHESLQQAERRIMIICWDINSRLRLVRDPDSGDGEALGDLLNRLAAEKPELEIYILDWDFAMIYLPDREFLPIYKLDWKSHPRVHFHLDNQHPEGASQHQKLVVIDDALAFVGGLDPTLGRWDSCAHRPDDQRRDTLDNQLANPYHDVQLMLNGEAVAGLAELARTRWETATGKELAPLSAIPPQPLWPDQYPPDIESAKVAIACTMPAWNGHQQCQEIQQLYCDAIHHAKSFIYIENQYFTAPAIADALAEQLRRPQGAEITIVLPKQTDGWLSQHTMDVLRVRQIRRLIELDHGKRLRVLYPDAPGLEKAPINVHAKVMVVDDILATVGSANLNNRSMGLDSECNIIIEGGNDSAKHGIASFRNRLLAEHLGCEQQQVEAELQQKSSLHAVIKSLGDNNRRHLHLLPLHLSPDIERNVPDTAVVDPEHPITPELMLPRFLPEKTRKPARSRLIQWLLLISAISLLAALWRWTPLSAWANVDTVSSLITSFREMAMAPLWVIGGFLLAGLIAFPFSLLILATVAVFGPLEGFFYSLAGGLLSAVGVYGIGELLGRSMVRQLAGEKLNSISQTLARNGLLTIIAVRIIPVAPFSIINLVAGASHINFRDYVTGTLLGMTPGMLAVIIIADQVHSAISDPGLMTTVSLLLSTSIIATAGFLLVRWLKRRSDRHE